MITALFYIIVAMIVGAIVFYLVAVVFGGRQRLAEVERDDTPLLLPEDRQLLGEEVLRVRLPVALRGYRMAETDEVLDRIGFEMQAKEAEIAALRAELAELRPEPAEPTPAEPTPAEPTPAEPMAVRSTAGGSDGAS